MDLDLVLPPDCLLRLPAQCAFCEKPLGLEQSMDFLYFLVHVSMISRINILDYFFLIGTQLSTRLPPFILVPIRL